MNSAVNHYSAAARQADALREAWRNPPLPAAAHREHVAGRSLFARVSRRTALRPAWGRL
jgi:hypothetical protein